ncbi:50S ribosomal protein L29 [Geomonas sp. RF6]|uniref:50S ribosomal protein L29 n=1 Tax=Geomonas sp. RF6 TaxID=2897342 RepID=UPI001E31FCC4|nr:50S ribosomal protein L29 [Geomonas sp. RF6]UFS68739.1 50S ribosomal protein L29 [Geomonas sp. RF6]
MKASELRNASVEDLSAKNAELTKELFNITFQLHTGRLENTAKLSLLKKDIARVKTILREKRG